MSSTERMILGNNCIYSGNPKETGLNRNVLIVGGTGSGKTVSFVEPALMEALYLPVGKIVVFRRGQRPVFSTRFDTFNDEFYKEITQTKKTNQRSEEDR